MNKQSYTTIPHICLHYVYGDLSFTCTLRILRVQAGNLILAAVRTIDINNISFYTTVSEVTKFLVVKSRV